MCPARSIRQKLLLSSTPLGALATAVTNPAQILNLNTYHSRAAVPDRTASSVTPPGAVLGVDPQLHSTPAGGLSLKSSYQQTWKAGSFSARRDENGLSVWKPAGKGAELAQTALA